MSLKAELCGRYASTPLRLPRGVALVGALMLPRPTPSPASLAVAPEIAAALAAGRPVVALESTVIAHGLPHPDNLEVTHGMMEAVRVSGALPAVIALDAGRFVIGADAALIDRLATARDVVKANLSNLAVTQAGGRLGATTVATTLWGAWLAGIRVFATGGTGGRHHAAGASAHDVSSDLEALQRFPCLTVSAGVKSILDVAGTREELETRGVPLLGFRTDGMPLFFSPPSREVFVDARLETAAEAAAAARAHWEIGGGGLLLVAPCPPEEAIPAERLAPVMERLEAAMPADVRGTRGATPWLLAALDRETGGITRRANKALLINNALVAGEVAAALVRL